MGLPRGLFTIIILFVISLATSAQNFDQYILDDDTICGISLTFCPPYAQHIWGHKKLDSADSLKCTNIEHFPLNNSPLVLTIERNFYGDTIAIGLKKEIKTESTNSYFFTRNVDRLIPTNTSYGDKIGEWYYYYPDGKLKEKIKY